MRNLSLVLVTMAVFAGMGVIAICNDESNRSAAQRDAVVAELKPLGLLVGEWRGSGQPRRGSSVGAWSEKVHGAWNFDNQQAKLILRLEPGQQFRSATFFCAGSQPEHQLQLEDSAENGVQLTRVTAETAKSEADPGTWVYESARTEWPQTRCTVRIISDIRVTLLFEERKSESASWRRLSEIGLTRSGSRLASGNTGERQCIVTGGLGAIKVTWKGKSYYVCCEGCRQAFDADPEGTIAAYQTRLKAGKSSSSVSE